MNTGYVEQVQIGTFSLDTVDAALNLVCRDREGIWHARLVEIPGKLIVYRITQQGPLPYLGTCGGIRLQYVSESRTRISVEIEVCDDLELARKFGRLSEKERHDFPYSSDEVFLNNGRHNVFRSRWETLVSLCKQTLSDLAVYHPYPVRSESQSMGHGGRPPLAQEEIALRMALGLLEEHLKKMDKDTKRGEVVLLAVEKLNIPADIGDVKDGMERLRRARHTHDQNLLQSAEELIQSWLPRLAA